MKSLGHKRGGGNLKLKGKKYKLLGCRCCAMRNKKDEFKKRDDHKEIAQFI